MQLPKPKASGLHGSLQVPGDKSISHRALMLGAIAQGQTRIEGFLPSSDCLSTLKALQDLGVSIQRTGTQVVVQGQGPKALHSADQPLAMNNAGTATRLLLGLLAPLKLQAYFVGDASLSKRPMNRVAKPLAQMGANLQTTGGHLPIHLEGAPLHGITYTMPVASAQVKSALLLAGLNAAGETVIDQPLLTRDHTERMIQTFGGKLAVSADQHRVSLFGGQKLIGQSLQVPGDMSSAAFFMAAASIVPHSDLTLTAVGLNPTRSGFLTVLQQMGGKVSVHDRRQFQSEPVGDIQVEASHLHAISIGAAQIPAVVDELPLVALLAACADGVSEVSGAQELRYKETDRIKTIVTSLSKMGVTITEKPDGFIVDGSKPWQPAASAVSSFMDHRIGMMLAVAALKVKTPVALTESAALAVSYPQFMTDLKQVLA